MRTKNRSNDIIKETNKIASCLYINNSDKNQEGKQKALQLEITIQKMK